MKDEFRRENIFKEARNYPYFLKLYAHHVESVADTFAYCLLPNHFHLLVRIKTIEEIEEETLKVSETFRVLTARPRLLAGSKGVRSGLGTSKVGGVWGILRSFLG